jgi:hypothetical protein
MSGFGEQGDETSEFKKGEHFLSSWEVIPEHPKSSALSGVAN